VLSHRPYRTLWFPESAGGDYGWLGGVVVRASEL